MPAQATAFGLRQPHVLIENILLRSQHGGTAFPAERRRASETSQAPGPLALPGSDADLLERNDSRGFGSFGASSRCIAAGKRRHDPDRI